MNEALERTHLLEQLQQRQLEADASEIRFKRLADMMPIGIFIIDKNRVPTYYNPALQAMFDINPNDPLTPLPWDTIVTDEDLPQVQESWEALAEATGSISFEARVKKSTSTHANNTSPLKTIWLSTYPDLDDTKSIKLITGCVMDISVYKDAERLQAQRVKEAVSASKQQEEFIDMTRRV